MQNITFTKGDILFSTAQTIANPVCCDGSVPCYLTRRFFARFQDMWERYQSFCERKLLAPGKLWIYPGRSHRVLNIPILEEKTDAPDPGIIEKGLQKFLDTYEEKEITSLSLPILFHDDDNSCKEEIRDLMASYLGKCDIPITIYEEYAPHSEVMIPLLTRLCGTISEEKKQEIREKICFELN